MRKVFEFFEVIAEELSVEQSRVLTRKDLQLNSEQAPLLDELKDELGSPSTEDAIRLAVEFLDKHFHLSPMMTRPADLLQMIGIFSTL